MLRTALRSACAVAVLALSMEATGFAQPADKRTLFTFSGPVAMPGVTLPGGQYLFRLADPTSGRQVVQVLSADGRTPYGLFFTLASDRVEPASTPEVRFMETAAGMPAAIKTWWYPGERRGYEFIYPKEQARRLAQGTSQPVLTTQAQTTTTEQTNTSDLSRIASTGQETNLSADASAPAAAPAGTQQQGQIAASSISVSDVSVPPAIPASRAASPAAGSPDSGTPARMARASLPATAGSAPVVALLGLVALCGGAGLWVWRRGSWA